MNQYITPHFSWAEAACHDGTPVPLELQPNARRLAQMAEKIRARFGGPIVPVSWYRTRAYNEGLRMAAIAAGRNPGAAKDSQHLLAHAMDARPADLGALPALIRCIEGMLAGGELPELGGLGVYPGWVHIDCRPPPASGRVARWQGVGVGSEPGAPPLPADPEDRE